MQYGSVDMGDSVQEWEWQCWTQFRNRNGIVGLSSGMGMAVFNSVQE